MSISEASESLSCTASKNHAAWLALRGAWCQAWLAAGEIQRRGSTQSFHSPWKSRPWEAWGQPSQAWLGSMGEGKAMVDWKGGSIMNHWVWGRVVPCLISYCQQTYQEDR